MIKKNFKGRCVKVSLSKCKVACRTYSPMQLEYAKLLNDRADISEIKCNVLLDDLEGDDEYTTDFVCVKQDGDLMVRECVYRKLLSRPLTTKLLDISREYWVRHGCLDWGIVIDAEE